MPLTLRLEKKFSTTLVKSEAIDTEVGDEVIDDVPAEEDAFAGEEEVIDDVEEEEVEEVDVTEIVTLH